MTRHKQLVNAEANLEEIVKIFRDNAGQQPLELSNARMTTAQAIAQAAIAQAFIALVDELHTQHIEGPA